jgi:cold-inducible RNA-binding protein
MSAKLFVGNLSYSTSDGVLQAAFSAHGEVLSASIVFDRASGRSRGFGFVEFAKIEDATRAIEAMNGALVDGRAVAVNAAREREAAVRRGGQ